jgi:hypothetical protein
MNMKSPKTQPQMPAPYKTVVTEIKELLRCLEDMGLHNSVESKSGDVDSVVRAFLFLIETGFIRDSRLAQPNYPALRDHANVFAKLLPGSPMDAGMRDFLTGTRVSSLITLKTNSAAQNIAKAVQDLIDRYATEANGSLVETKWINNTLQNLFARGDNRYRAKIAAQLWIPTFFCSLLDGQSGIMRANHGNISGIVDPFLLDESEFTFDDCFRYYEAARLAWPGTELPFGCAFHVYARCTNPAIERALDPPVDYFTRTFGERRELLIPVLRQSPFSELCETIIEEMPAHYRSFVRRYYNTIHFLVEEAADLGPLPFTADAVRLPSGIPSNWEYRAAVTALMVPDKVKVVVKEIDQCAREILGKVDKKELSKEFNLSAAIKEFRLRTGMRVLVARLSLLYLGIIYKGKQQEVLERDVGYVGRADQSLDKAGTIPTNKNAFSTYVNEYGLDMSTIFNPTSSNRVFDHELKLIESFTNTGSV